MKAETEEYMYIQTFDCRDAQSIVEPLTGQMFRMKQR